MLRVKASTYFWTTSRTAKKKVSLPFLFFIHSYFDVSSMTFVLTYLFSDLPAGWNGAI